MSGGDGGTFDDFVVTSAARLGRTAALLTGDRHLAEDLLQTALAKTYLRWHRLREPAAAEAYVRRVMVNQLVRWRRRRWTGEVPAAELPERAGDAGATGDAYGDSDTRAMLRAALATLPRAQRAVLVLRYFEDLTEDETARVLGCSRGTVKSRTARALARLRELDLLDAPPGVVGLPAAETP
jgi:RNA polymerase sigma-70 factor (sigma-E family)